MRLDHLLSKEYKERQFKKDKVLSLFFKVRIFLRKAVRLTERRNKEHFGGVAQLGEHLPCKQGVRSSNLLISTKKPDN